MKRHLLLVAALVAAVLVGTAAPASATTNLISFASYTNGQCGDVYLGSIADGTPVVSQPCHHYAEQLWWVYPTSDGSPYFEFKNYLTNKCLATSNDGTSGYLVQTICHGGTEQQWTWNGTSAVPVPGNVRYRFKNRRSGLCMQAGAGGAKIGMNYCGSGTNQLWVVNN